MLSNPRLYPPKTSSRYYILTQLRLKLEKIIPKYLENRTKSLKLLDYGCGTMPYLTLYEPFVSDYIGADFIDNLEAKLIIEDKGKLPIDSENIDIVVSNQVLEHVSDVNFYLQESYRVLKKEGILILSTHGVWQYHPHPVDYWRWTHTGLTKILTAQDFKILEVVRVGGLAVSGLQLFQDGVLSFLSKRWQSWFIFFIQKLQIWVDKRDRNINDACVFIIVAQK